MAKWNNEVVNIIVAIAIIIYLNVNADVSKYGKYYQWKCSICSTSILNAINGWYEFWDSSLIQSWKWYYWNDNWKLK